MPRVAPRTDLLEPCVRRVVAEQLGVNADELTADVLLTDDLAVDSLDFVELALALEGELAVAIPEAMLDAVRTFGDLVAAVEAAVRGRDLSTTAPVLVAARIVSSRFTNKDVQYAGPLTPYTAETIADWALHAGDGAELEITVPSTLSDEALDELMAMFSRVTSRGIQVTHRVAAVSRGAHPGAAA